MLLGRGGAKRGATTGAPLRTTECLFEARVSLGGVSGVDPAPQIRNPRSFAKHHSYWYKGKLHMKAALDPTLLPPLALALACSRAFWK